MNDLLLTIGLDLGLGEIEQITPLTGDPKDLYNPSFLRLTFGTHYHEGETSLTIPRALVSDELLDRLCAVWKNDTQLQLTLSVSEK